jgi:hypothetical protein
MTTPDMRIWHYFLMLERDFAATAAFVEPHVSNHKTFSDRYAGLLLLIGSEVDVVAKQLTKINLNLRLITSRPMRKLLVSGTRICTD